MKKLLLLLAVLLVSVNTMAQRSTYLNLQGVDDKPYHFGLYLAGNSYDFKLHPEKNALSGENFNVLAKRGGGFSVGLIYNSKITDHVSLRLEPGIDFNTRTILFTTLDNDPVYKDDNIREVKSTYLNIPIFVKFNGDRINNFRPYMAGGIGYAVNLTSNQSSTDDNLQDVFRTKTHNFNWQAELGLEFYTSYVKVIPYIKGIFFFNDELIPDNKADAAVAGSTDTPNIWAGAIRSLKTRGVQFGIKFEY